MNPFSLNAVRARFFLATALVLAAILLPGPGRAQAPPPPPDSTGPALSESVPTGPAPAGPVPSQSVPAEPAPVDPTPIDPARSLSALEVDRFVADWPRFVQWARERGEEFDRPTAPDAIFEELLSRRAAEFIKSMGWVPERFSRVVERITALLSGVRMEEFRDRIKGAHEAERIETENNPDLTESQRVRRLDEIDESWARMEEFEKGLREADPEEAELIRTNQERLMKALKTAYQGY